MKTKCLLNDKQQPYLSQLNVSQPVSQVFHSPMSLNKPKGNSAVRKCFCAEQESNLNRVKCLWGRKAGSAVLKTFWLHSWQSLQQLCESALLSNWRLNIPHIWEEKLVIYSRRASWQSYPVFPWLLPNLNHILSILPNKNSLRCRKRAERTFWWGIINTQSWRGLGQTVNCSSTGERFPCSFSSITHNQMSTTQFPWQDL